MDTITVTRQIEQAWAKALYPGDENLGDGSSLESLQVAAFFRGKQWKDLSLSSLLADYVGDGSACLSFLSPLAYRYYLPAYMLIAVDQYDNADMIADSAWSSLNPSYPHDSEMYLWWRERAEGFSPEQIRAIVDFLGFMDSAHSEDYPLQGPRNALGFWLAKL